MSIYQCKGCVVLKGNRRGIKFVQKGGAADGSDRVINIKSKRNEYIAGAWYSMEVDLSSIKNIEYVRPGDLTREELASHFEHESYFDQMNDDKKVRQEELAGYDEMIRHHLGGLREAILQTPPKTQLYIIGRAIAYLTGLQNRI